MSENKIDNDELVFIQSSSIHEREKIKELWKFLDSQCNLQPYRPLQSRCKSSLQSYTQDQSSKSSENSKRPINGEISNLKTISSYKDEDPDKERIWYHGLRFFQQIGLDKAVLCKDKCKFCLAEKGFQNTNYADTISQIYDELKAEMASFDELLADYEVKTLNSSQN